MKVNAVWLLLPEWEQRADFKSEEDWVQVPHLMLAEEF